MQSDVKAEPWMVGEGRCTGRTCTMANVQGAGQHEEFSDLGEYEWEGAGRRGNQGWIIKCLRSYDSSGNTLRILNKSISLFVKHIPFLPAIIINNS